MDHIQRAFSDEKLRNMELIDRQKGKDMHISQLENQIVELKSDNVRLNDAEIVACRELDSLKDRNKILLSEAESMRGQIRVQEDAIMGA